MKPHQCGRQKILLGAVCLCLCSTLLPAGAASLEYGFLTGNDYRALSYGSRRGYVIGVIDGLYVSAAIGGNEPKLHQLKLCIAHTTGKQLTVIVDRFISDPKYGDQNMNNLVFDALTSTCRERGFEIYVDSPTR